MVTSNKASVSHTFDVKPHWVKRMVSRLNKNEFKSRVGVFETNLTGVKQRNFTPRKAVQNETKFHNRKTVRNDTKFCF